MMTTDDTRGANEEIRFAVGQTSLGAILVASSTKGIASSLLGDEPEDLVHDLQDPARYGKAHRAVPPRVDPLRYRAVYRSVVRLATKRPTWSTGI